MHPSKIKVNTVAWTQHLLIGQALVLTECQGVKYFEHYLQEKQNGHLGTLPNSHFCYLWQWWGKEYFSYPGNYYVA